MLTRQCLAAAFIATSLASPSLAADAPPSTDQAPTVTEKRMQALERAIKDAQAGVGRSSCNAPYEHPDSCRIERPAVDAAVPDQKR